MIYIDFDGVILDTVKLMFEEWDNCDKVEEMDRKKYFQNLNWKYILNNSSEINNSISYLKQMNSKKTCILTKINSLDNEGVAKVEWVRENNIKQNIILVPYTTSKADIVDAKGNILIDDCLKNLDEWEKNGGTGILFDINNDNYDSWNMPNEKGYKTISDLSEVFNFE